MVKNNYSGRKNVFKSKKTGKVFNLKSVLERRYASILDDKPEVISFDYETIPIPYRDTDGKTRTYKPDFIYVTIYKTVHIIEVKPHVFVNTEEVQIKKNAAISFISGFYSNFNISYEIISEEDISNMEYNSRVSIPIKVEAKNVQRRRNKKKACVS